MTTIEDEGASSSSDASTLDDDIIPNSYKSQERWIIFTKTSVIKRDLQEREMIRRMQTGEVVRPFWAEERLRNEAATLQYLAANTTIPVPKFLGLYYKSGLLHLETERVKGAVEMSQLDRTEIPAALDEVERFLNTVVLPQLRKIRRNSIGSIDDSIPVFPPSRIYGRSRESWPKITSTSQEFCLVHNDLARQNILLRPKTYDVVAILDWEFAGFFPPDFELPFWREDIHGYHKMMDDAGEREHTFFKPVPSGRDLYGSR